MKLPAGFNGNYNDLTNVPANLTTIVNNNFSGDYSELTNTPAIPTNVSELNNDAGYLTSEVDGSITNELQIINISNDTMPAGFSGNYNDLTNKPDFTGWDTNAANDFNGDYNNLTNKPVIPANVSDLTNDAGYLTNEIDGSVTNELQALSISNDTVYLSNGGFVKLPAGFDGQYSSLTGVPTNVSSFTNDADYLTIENDTMLWKKNGNDLFYNAGNVGIGTTSPINKLTVEDSTGGSETWTKGILIKNTGWSGEPAIAFNNDQTGSNYWITGINEETSYNIAYGTSFTLPTTKFTILSTGNVGIGTMEPNSKFQVTGGDTYIQTIGNGVILRSPDGTCYRVTVANGGGLVTTAVACP
ncbi:MAG: hypothetical protein HY738_10905 [Bacteroidia bacterium]|nr:hypothetical protein [Bacteroidia bacterium]